MKEWRKVLYEHQNVPDNYVDSSFLDELKRNINVHEYNYLNVVYETGSIVRALSRVVWLVAVFIELAAGSVKPVFLLVACISTLLACYLPYVFLQRQNVSFIAILQNCRSLLLVLMFSYVLSPVIQTLTSTISSDTIYCMTLITMIAHLIVHNYGVANAPIVSDVLSFNAAIFGATCLSSRLASPLHCFGFIVFAVGLFALAPEFGNVIKKRSNFADVVQTFLHVIGSILLMYRLSRLFSLLYVTVVILITFICPAILVVMQPLKSTISGPWDEAVLDEEALNKSKPAAANIVSPSSPAKSRSPSKRAKKMD